MIPDNEYLFSSSFLRAGEGIGTASGRTVRMLEASSAGQLYQTVAEVFQIPVPSEEKHVFDAAFSDAVEKMRGAVPDASVYDPLLYKYDCTNIKLVLKCAVQGIRSFRDFYTCGTVSAAQMEENLQKDTAQGLPPAMTEATEAARQEYAKTGEVRCIDLLLDQACFADMSAAANAGNVPLIQKIVCMWADFANILTCLRIRRSGVSPEATRALMKRAFVPGGQVGLPVLLDDEFGCADISRISEILSGCHVRDAVRRTVAVSDISAVEKIFDEAVLAVCQPYRFKPFGPEIAVRYLLIRETELTNGRIIASKFSAGTDADKIRERLREVDV